MNTINNHVLRSLRYTLDLNDQQMVEIFRLADPETPVDARAVTAMLRRDEDEGFLPCSGAHLSSFLDGLIVKRRGPDPRGAARTPASSINNNLIMKKLRVAFELKDLDLLRIFDGIGFAVSRPELSAFFRQPDHRNYRSCGDQILRQFLQGLTKWVRPA